MGATSGTLTRSSLAGIASTFDYPLPVRIIADTKDGEAKCYEDVRRFYPSVQRSELWRMLSDPEAFFYRYRRNVVLM